MSQRAEQSRALKNIAHICRTTMGLVFIVSGFVKAIDPWGTMIKVEEYLAIYGWEALIPWSIGVSIWLCGAELMMGCMLTFKVRIRFVSIFALLSMSIFTVVALLSATVLPVEDCGCFGEALKLTPWQTFFKNLTLLPMAFIVFWRYRPDKIFLFKRAELMLAATFFLFAMGLPTYCYLHLPLIDYLPYKIGVNLPEAIREAKSAKNDDTRVTLVYKNKKSGRLRHFDFKDKAWHDESKWEWVETIVEDDKPDIRALVGEFSIRRRNGDLCTDEILETKGILHILFVDSFNRVDEKCRDNFRRLIKSAEERGERVIFVTPRFINPSGKYMGVECYNIDPTTMKTALRASYGVMSLCDGIIIDKRNCRDI
ncbi:MAG: BT_3928 family protein [Rikenellaceae bacterium]